MVSATTLVLGLLAAIHVADHTRYDIQGEKRTRNPLRCEPTFSRQRVPEQTTTQDLHSTSLTGFAQGGQTDARLIRVLARFEQVAAIQGHVRQIKVAIDPRHHASLAWIIHHHRDTEGTEV